MEKIKETIKAEIWDIKVGKKYYSFMYRTYRNGKWTKEYAYDNDHCRSISFMKNHLKNGGAVDIIMMDRFESN